MSPKFPGTDWSEERAGVSHLLHYRCYLLDDRGAIRRGANLQCADDSQALARALELSGGQPFEVWQGVRRVHVSPPGKPREEV